MTDRHARTLCELQDLGMSLARQVHADAVAAETPDARVASAKAFHTLSRSVRQTLALEAKLRRDQLRAERDALAQAQADAERQAEARQDQRKAQVRGAVAHLIWNEWDLPSYRAENLLRDVDTKLDGMDFDLDEPVDDQILFLARRLGYTLGPVQDDQESGEAPAQPASTREPPEPIPFNGRLAQPRDIPDWCDDDSP